MSSEIGVLNIKPENVVKHGRLEPGKMFLVDMNAGRIIEDEEIKKEIISKKPYKKWVSENVLPLVDIPYTNNNIPTEVTDYKTRLRLFGYTTEEISTIISPMAISSKEGIGSMGTDTPLAVLSDKPQLLYNYFKQLFAQVTNPPLDGIREEIITDISLAIGSDGNIFDVSPEQAKKLLIQNPVISNEDLDKIKNIDHSDFKATSISILFPLDEGVNGIERALDFMLDKAVEAVDSGSNIIILSDRGVTKENAPIPALLACSYLHHSLSRKQKRSKFGIVMETAEPREPHHFATLFGYGASAINPYMVNEIITHQVETGEIIGINSKVAVKNFNKAI